MATACIAAKSRACMSGIDRILVSIDRKPDAKTTRYRDGAA
jgi:hypothetical protein